MITLHHLNHSRSQRILWMLEELGAEYEVKHYSREKSQLAPEALKKIHALGKSPVITCVDDVVAESGAIIEYLCDKFESELKPKKDTPEYQQYKYWLHYAEGTLMSQLLVKGMFDRVKTAPMPFFVKVIARKIADKAINAYSGPNVKTNIAYLENHLANNEWFCGDKITGADIQMSFPMEVIVAREGGNEFPNISAWVKKIHGRPAYKKALEAGGKYVYA